MPAPLHLSELPLSLSLALSLPLLLDLVKRQDVLLLFTAGLAVSALGALEEEAGEITQKGQLRKSVLE